MRLLAPEANEKSTLTAGAAARPATTVRARLDSIDLLRGVVMLLMALDHTRDFFGNSGMNPRDVTEPALFLTRWITHLCAPVFILLAGVSAFLYGARGRSRSEVSRFLLTRGLWLILLEFTVMRVGWSFDLSPSFFVAQVIWAIGASMVALSALIHLPRPALIALAVVTIAGHNLFDGIKAAELGSAGWIWSLLHEPAILRLAPGISLLTLYPLVPWVAVMAAGYALGPVFKLDRPVRARWLAGLGALITAGFFLLRSSNLYGDPAPWAAQGDWLATALSFLNCEKYPPSLLYLMMTLGPGLLLLAAFEGARGRIAGWVTTFGRVPFFFYVVHIYLIHALAVVFAWVTTGEASWLLGGAPTDKSAAYGLGLPGVYAATLVIVALLYPLCRWFAGQKQRRSGWWWSYL